MTHEPTEPTDEEVAAEVLEELDRRIERGENSALYSAMRPYLHEMARRDPALFAATTRDTLAEFGWRL